MATFKDLWDFPNNSSNGYATDSADWSGDESFGLDQRIAELKLGNYKAWNGLDPVADLSKTTVDLNTAIAKYAFGLEHRGPDENLTMYNLWYNPIVEGIGFGDHNLTVSEIVSNGDSVGRVAYKVTTSTDHDYVQTVQFQVDFKDTTDASLPSAVSTHLNDTSAERFANNITGDDDSFWVYSSTIANNIDHITLDPTTTVFIRDAAGVHSYSLDSTHTSSMTDSDEIRFYNGDSGNIFSETHDTGTIDTGGVARYITKGTDTSGASTLYTIDYFTDSGKTTNADLTEHYYATITHTLDNQTGTDQTYDLGYILSSATGNAFTTTIAAGTGEQTGTDTFPELNVHFEREHASGNGIRSFCRVYYNNRSGSGGSFATSPTLNNNSINYDQLGYITYTEGSPSVAGDDSINIATVWGGNGDVSDGGSNAFQITVPPGETVDIIIKVINPGRISHPDTNGDASSVAVEHLTYSSGLGTVAVKGGLDKKFVNSLNIVSGGNEQYQFQNVSNVTTAGGEFDSTVYYRTDSAQTTAHPNGEVLADTYYPTAAVTVDSNGRISSIATPVRGSGGIFDDTTHFLCTFKSKADTYVAPTVYAEDVWDTDDEWDSNAYSDAKMWPTHVAPRSAKLITNMPSTSTISQSGIKFIRSSGVIKTELEFEYPPMKYDEFREFEAVAQAAQGQKTPFYVHVRDVDSQSLLFQRTDTNANGGLTAPYDFRVREDIAVGDKVITAEGFPSNQTDALIRGETIIADLDYRNGDLTTIINSVDSNKYGEVKFRVPYGSNKTISTGSQFYKNPSKAIVTLAEDSFEYSVTTDGYYYVVVKFDLDEFK